MKRKIGIISVGRSDYSLYLPLMKKILKDPQLNLQLFVVGSHHFLRHGKSIQNIRSDQIPITEEIILPKYSGSPQNISESMAVCTQKMAFTYKKYKPDFLFFLGDRYEMHAAAVAAIPFNIPMGHIAGGALTYGSYDEYFRHSLTKICHLHFVATKEYAQRIIQMGEEPWRICISGALGVEHALTTPSLPLNQMKYINFKNKNLPLILVTFHPVTLEKENTVLYITQLLSALDHFDTYNMIFTSPGPDVSGQWIQDKIKHFTSTHQNTLYIKNCGTEVYVSLLKMVSVMVGNSSSGLIEAPSFRLPVVNIGTRQTGRIKAKNVIDTDYTEMSIRKGIELALSLRFRNSLKNLVNPYGDGKASSRILKFLARLNFGPSLHKKFHDRKWQ